MGLRGRAVFAACITARWWLGVGWAGRGAGGGRRRCELGRPAERERGRPARGGTSSGGQRAAARAREASARRHELGRPARGGTSSGGQLA
jgi:hypothetical protein